MSSREPQPRWLHGAFGVGLKYFLWGGAGSLTIRTAEIETFDITSAQWLNPQPLKGSPPDRLEGMAVTTDGDYAYSFGGWNGSTSNHIYEINSRTLQCMKIPLASSYSPPEIQYSAIVCFNEKLVAYRGWTGQGPTDDLYVFDLRKSECGNSKLYSCQYEVYEMRDVSSALRPLLVSVMG